MNYFKIKYLNYIVITFISYIAFLVLKRLFNIYILLFVLSFLFISYKTNKRLFKKIAYKVLYKGKKDRLYFKNKFNAAKINLEGITEINNKIKDNVKAKILNYEKDKLESQLKAGDYNVTLFGTGSTGKTSIARSLLKSIIGNTSPTLGTTKDITSYKIRIPILKRNINIIDTPGLFEPSEKGKYREKATILQATNSDIILFVLDQDINKYENYLINEFIKIGKKIVIVLNKCDLRTKDENLLIEQNIKSITSSTQNNISIVRTIAIPIIRTFNDLYVPDNMPDVRFLFKEIINILDDNGEELLADNILYRSNKLGIQSKRFISEQRFLTASKTIKKYMWVTGGVILVNPLPGLDFITTTSVNVQMIIEISRIYEVKITKNEAIDLAKSLLEAIAKLGIIKGGVAIITTVLSTSFTSIAISKTIQSITAGWLIKIVGHSLIEYFKNGQNWGDGGIQEVVERIYRLNKREEVLNNFVNEAISKIKLNKYSKYQNKLPPFTN